MKKVQISNRHKSWLSLETRGLILQRDMKREEARSSNLDAIWMEYRKLRNKCTARVKKDGVKNYNEIHNEIDRNKDIKELYNQTKAQLGWNVGKTPETFLVDGMAVNSPKKLLISN